MNNPIVIVDAIKTGAFKIILVPFKINIPAKNITK